MVGACVVRDAAGRVIESPLVTAMGNFSNFTLNATGDETMFQTAAFPYYAVDENLTAFASYAFDFNSTVTTIDNRTNATKPCLPGRCKYGMHNDMQVTGQKLKFLLVLLRCGEVIENFGDLFIS